MRPTRRLLLAAAAALAAPLGAAGSANARAWGTGEPAKGVLAFDIIGRGESLEFRIRNVSGQAISLHSPFDHSVPIASRVRIRRQPQGYALTQGYNNDDEWMSTAVMASTAYTEASTRKALKPLAAGGVLSRTVALETLIFFAQPDEAMRPERRYSLDFMIDPTFARDDGVLRWTSVRAPQTCTTAPGPHWAVAVG